MKEFQTESKKLLDLMINSIYTNREIFLRELISNASDATDKLVFKGLTDTSLEVDRDKLSILVGFDKDARTVTVKDCGIGMTSDELDRNLGTIAHSGSEQFKREQVAAKAAESPAGGEPEQRGEADGDAATSEAGATEAGQPDGAKTGDATPAADAGIDVIGQFGVGFYSSFMVADKVTVVSRAAGMACANVWESDGVSGYDIRPATSEEAAQVGEHGSVVTLHLRANTEDNPTDELLSEWKLKELIRRYSNYVHYPIQMNVTRRRELPKPDDAPDDYKPQYESYTELETVNSIKPIWTKRAGEVTREEYNEFYKTTFRDFSDPARVITFHAEGRISYDALVFVPSKAPFDLYSKDYEKGLALYQSGVLIQEKCADLVPDYFNFVRGVVDSPDVTLNISRETLQQSSQLQAIGRQIERRVRADLGKMLADDRAAYEQFFDNFGRGIKFGIYASYGMKASELADLLLFWSARQGKMVTLREYVDAMPEGQEKLYYAAGDSRERLEKTPAVKAALSHGYDVLLATEDVDEFMFQAMRAYHVDEVPAAEEGGQAKPARDVEFANVADAKLDLATDEEKKQAQEAADDNKALLDAVKEALGDKVSSVTVAAGLGDAPAVVTAEGPVSLEMERVMAQGPEAAHAPKAQRVLELNAAHPVFAKLAAAQKDGKADEMALYASLLLDQALLVAGLPVEDPVAFAENVCKLM